MTVLRVSIVLMGKLLIHAFAPVFLVCILTASGGLHPDRQRGWLPAGVCRNWRTESLTRCFPGSVIRRPSACTRMPHREGNSIGTHPPFYFWHPKPTRRLRKIIFFLYWDSSQGPLIQGPVRHPLGYRFTPISVISGYGLGGFPAQNLLRLTDSQHGAMILTHAWCSMQSPHW